jgi:hypothetical protein
VTAVRHVGTAGAEHVGELARWYADSRRWPTVPDATGRPLLPVGDEFDVVEVAAAAGRDALERLTAYGQAALAPGPVAATGHGRYRFFVAPGGRDDLDELLEWLDWGGIALDIRAYGRGDLLVAPGLPCRNEPNTAGESHALRDDTASYWVHAPLGRPPELIALLATLADCAHRWALARLRDPATASDVC